MVLVYIIAPIPQVFCIECSSSAKVEGTKERRIKTQHNAHRASEEQNLMYHQRPHKRF